MKSGQMRETQHIAEAVGLVALSHVISVSHNDSNGSSKDSVGNSADNSISSHIAVPAINYMSTDGTVGETNSLASGHADHDCDNGHDHDEHQPDHDHSETSHAPGCSCGNCLALASNGVKDPTDHGEHDTVANVAA